MPEIGYYAHHMGSGHVIRAKALTSALTEPATILTSYRAGFKTDRRQHRVIFLPEDHAHFSEYDQGLSPVPACLHHAPLNVQQIRERTAIMANYFAQQRPALLVVDVSAEVVQFARLCSVPTIAVRLNGEREDLAHEQAFKSARKVLAPFPRLFEDPVTPDWLKHKTFYTGGFSRYDGRKLKRKTARQQLGIESSDRCVVIINGMYGAGHDGSEFVETAAQNPDYQWFIIGKLNNIPTEVPANLHIRGIVPDTFPYLRAADVVVGSAGDNTVMEIGTAKARYICVPEDRPYNEQMWKAAALKKCKAALVRATLPEPHEWSRVLNKARNLDIKCWKRIMKPKARQHTARFLEKIAAEASPAVQISVAV